MIDAPVHHIECDILILGSGGAGLMAAIHAHDQTPGLSIVMATKGLVGKSGCTRIIQGGFNAVLNPADSIELHFQDTVVGGAWINDQDLAWTLVNDAPKRVVELESQHGVFFDRDAQGRIHQKAFAGQSFDRTVHRGDLTGIEIVSRLRDQLFMRKVQVLEETRALDLLSDGAGRVVRAVLLDMRRGEFVVVHATATMVCTGGGASIYRIASPSLEKSGDGSAICYRAGAIFRDMEFLQFHPTGLLAGASRSTGSVLEEGLRGTGAYLLNKQGERFMQRYDPVRMERSTRDIVSQACYREIMAGRGSPEGGVWLDISHKGADFVKKHFPGMRERVLTTGRDLAKEPVEVSPTAHFVMGGVRIDPDCFTNVEGLFVAGEDAGGVHGANRLGGNGVCESIVFGARCGDSMGQWVRGRSRRPYSERQAREIVTHAVSFLGRPRGENPSRLRQELRDLMWERAGVVRNNTDLLYTLDKLAEFQERAARMAVPPVQAFNRTWQDALDVESLLVMAEMLTRSALMRTESRGAHCRDDYPTADDKNWLRTVMLQRDGDTMRLWTEPVSLHRLRPDQVKAEAGLPPSAREAAAAKEGGGR